MRTITQIITTILLLLVTLEGVTARNTLPKSVSDSVTVALQRITLKEVAGCYVKVESIKKKLRGARNIVEVRTSVELSYYPMRPESVTQIYDAVRNALPTDYRKYSIYIYTDGQLIDRLIPGYYLKNNDRKRFTNSCESPLIRRTSRVSQPSQGLLNRHIALWQSHGRYFNQGVGEWRWQRSRLWETVEDLYTQSYVLQYLVPMLEHAGANVLLPRERSTTEVEVIIDNDEGIDPTTYRERGGAWSNAGVGFAHRHYTYPSGHNPFTDGTSRMIHTTTDVKRTATASWGGEIPEDGLYSVYISYTTRSNSVTDAHYTIHASGGDHTFSINQRMGGGMWVCLGEFYFERGDYDQLVTLSNLSSNSGVVVADAVKIGGGMGNIRRSIDFTLRKEGFYYTEETSGYPRFTEGARYWLQWSGFSPSVYSPKSGKDDYKEDYMSRALWVNALTGGSAHNKGTSGKGIPIDLALAVHSDAGVRLNDDIIGTLGIYSTKENRGEFDNDISRLNSRDLTDIVMTQIVSDIRHEYEPKWTRRGMWNRAYYEARMTSCPTMLLELLSHQNFADMRYGLDPTFRFTVSRAIYKGILRYLSSQYNTPYTIQPLPINSFAVRLEGDTAHLSWRPTKDALEPTAEADYYILYTRVDDGGFDSGRRINGTTTSVQQEPGKIYSYRITAVNDGGESFDSETLAACYTPHAKGSVMIINGFDRVAAPMSVQGDSIAGFYNRYDSGVGYIEDISFIGEQTIFDRKLSRSENDNYALGTCYNDYESDVIAGNSFDYPALHGRAIAKAGYSFCSSSHSAVSSGQEDITGYDAVDIILGKQRTTSIGRGTSGYKFEAMPEEMQSKIREYTKQGGAVFVSGSYLLTDLWHSPIATSDDRTFAEDILHVTFGGNMATRRGEVYAPASHFTQRRLDVEFNTELSRDIYSVESPEVVTPKGRGTTTLLRYRANAQSAAVGYRGEHRAITMGFPFECIKDEQQRNELMLNVLTFLTEDKQQ